MGERSTPFRYAVNDSADALYYRSDRDGTVIASAAARCRPGLDCGPREPCLDRRAKIGVRHFSLQSRVMLTLTLLPGCSPGSHPKSFAASGFAVILENFLLGRSGAPLRFRRLRFPFVDLTDDRSAIGVGLVLLASLLGLSKAPNSGPSSGGSDWGWLSNSSIIAKRSRRSRPLRQSRRRFSSSSSKLPSLPVRDPAVPCV